MQLPVKFSPLGSLVQSRAHVRSDLQASYLAKRRTLVTKRQMCCWLRRYCDANNKWMELFQETFLTHMDRVANVSTLGCHLKLSDSFTSLTEEFTLGGF